MDTVAIRFILVSLVCILSACGATDTSSDRDSQFTSTLSTELSSRVISVPMPVRFENGQVVLDGAGRPVPQWDGSIVDLFAADAWAQCAANVNGEAASRGADQNADFYLGKLEQRMSAAACSSSNTPEHPQLTIVGCTPQYCSPVKRWAKQRETLACNVNPDTRVPTTARFYPNNNPSTLSPRLPPPDQFSDVKASSADVLRRAIRSAQHHVEAASMNLCMAQRLREYITSADSLLLSADDQRELLDVVRMRAQVAMLRYAQIGRALTNPDDRPNVTITGEDQIFPIFVSWGKRADASLAGMGKDFGAAIKLVIDTTSEEAKLLVRSAAARTSRNNKARGTPQDDWGAASWRQQLLSVMYGHIRQSTSLPEIDFPEQGPPSSDLDSGWYNSPWPNQFPPLSATSYYVKTDASDPSVQLLLGLARNADALLLKERATEVTLMYGLKAPFRRVDVEPSADQLYRDVDAWIWSQDCVRAGNTNCTIRSNDPRVPPTSQFEQSLLFKRHGITPSHAKTLALLLSDIISRQQLPEALRSPRTINRVLNPPTISETEGAFHVTGKHETLTGPALEARAPGASGVWYHLDKDFRNEELSLAERAPLYTTEGFYWMPRVFDELAGAEDQKLTWNQHPGHTDMGAISALAAVWDLVTASLGNASDLLRRVYFKSTAASLDSIDSAIGLNTTIIRPAIRIGQEFRFCEIVTGTSSQTWCPTPLQLSSPDGNKVQWDVDTRSRADDPFFAGGEVRLIAVQSNGLEATAALDPNFVSISGKTSADYLVNSMVGSALMASSSSRSDGTVQRTYRIELPALDPRLGNASDSMFGEYDSVQSPSYYSFFLRHSVGGIYEYRLMGRNIALHLDGARRQIDPSNPQNISVAYHPYDGQYFAYGGAFGDILAKAWATHPTNWSKPAFDGFGFPIDWVPPVSPSLSAPPSASNSIGYYLSSARTAADEGTVAVKVAVEQLLREEADESTREIAQKKAQEIDALEQRALCGDTNPTCDTSARAIQILTDLKCENPAPNNPCNHIIRVLQDVLPKRALLAEPVISHINDESPPSFLEYSGGAYQRALLSQWGAYRKMARTAHDIVEAGNARTADVIAAYAQLDATEGTKAAECRKSAFEQAFHNGLSYSGGWLHKARLDATDDAVLDWRVDEVDSKSWSPGPLVDQQRRCNEAKKDLPIAKAKHASVIADAWAWISTSTTQAIDAVTAFQLATVDLLHAKHETKLAKAKANLEAALAEDNLSTRFGTSRRYHSLDMWRAQALLESARRYATTARRAIEARYVVDLSRMRSDETFVASPAIWADDVYEYDLNAPAAVGLSSRGDVGAGAIYANVLTDYVQNLARFVDGYAVARPTAAVSTDADLLALVGPDVRDTATVDGQPVATLAEGTRPWDFYCSNSAKWITHPAAGQVPATASLMTACNGSAPTRARRTFTLDPWGRLNGATVDGPYNARHNVRWKRLAANFVGQGVLDCTYATNATDCSGKPYIPYTLRFSGPVWVTDFDQQWRLLRVPSGRIEAGKALANQWFDPVNNGWGKPNAVAVARQELDELPLGGAYTLEFDVPPEVRLDRLKFIQLLTEITYWVKQ